MQVIFMRDIILLSRKSCNVNVEIKLSSWYTCVYETIRGVYNGLVY